MNELRVFLQSCDEQTKAKIDALIADEPEPSWFDYAARDSQQEPSGSWRYWLILAGRGWGKTRTIVEWAKRQAHEMPGSRGMIVASTVSDARDVLIEGESGFLNTSTDITYHPAKAQLSWANGTTALIRGAEKPQRLRGPQQHWAIADELAAWQYRDTWDMLMMGLRLGNNPRCAIATTPRPIPIVKELMADPHCYVTRGSSYENRENLAPAFFEQIISRYEGTRLGRQELDAELLEDVPGALWTRATLEETRVKTAPDLVRVVVGFDPAASDVEGAAESGVIVAGRDSSEHGYVLADYSVRGSVDERLSAIVRAYHRHEADAVIVEANNGGDWLPHAIRNKDASINVRIVHASRGKYTRAEPISGLYEQKRVHHVGMFGPLEDQLCTWVPGDISPDRLDALVWAMSELIRRPAPRAASSRQG